MPDVASLQPGDPEAVAGYRLAGRLGQGGQGTVFLGYGTAGERVAVKILHARMAQNTTARARFAREIDAMRRVAPFCTARVLAADVDGDIPYLISELVDGVSLQEVVRRDGPLRGADLERLAVGTLTALTAVHRAGIVHRDFKPANVLLSAQGPRVVDFGIARVLDSTSTLTSQAIGTPAYMAPEQLDGQAIGPAVDMFAWACTMVYAATGTPPFGSDSVPAVIGRILDDEPNVAGVTGPLRDIVVRCLGKDPTARPGAEELLRRLLRRPTGAAEATLVEGARMAGMPTRVDLHPITRVLPVTTRRRRFAVVGAAAMAVLLVAGAAVWLVTDGHASARRPNPPPPAPTRSIPAAVAGWNTTIDTTDDLAYDMPPSWDRSDLELGFGLPGTDALVILSDLGRYASDPCRMGNASKTARVMVGFTAYKEADLDTVAKAAVVNWAAARYTPNGAKRVATVERASRRVESTSVGGMRAVHASATVIVPSPDGCQFPPRAVIHAVALRSPKRAHTVTAFVVMADRDVSQAVPDRTLQQIIGSLRPITG